MAAPARLVFIPDLVEEHYEELQFLWGLRRNALHSATHRERDILLLEERIEAHAQGVLVIGDRLATFVAPGLSGEDEMPAFAAAFTLLRLGTSDALARVTDAFETAKGDKVSGLRDALAHSPTVAVVPRLTTWFDQAAAPIAAAAGEALAFHGAMNAEARDLNRLVLAEDASARAGAWRLVTYCGLSVPASWYDRALNDDDVTVKRAALTAAAWNGSSAFPPYCRAIMGQPVPETIEALAIYASIAPPEDYQLIASVATNPAAGPNRFRVVGSFAHPYFIDLLIKEMENADPAAAVAAGAAFFKMTGRDVESDKRVKVSPDGKPPADDFEAEFQDEVFLPDPELARKHWQELAPTLARSPRICRGMDVSQPLSREQFALLDMESRWEYCLRMRLFSGWQGTPLVLERYPQRF
jgi:uncharacterized protein (TIGR02270 family)